MSSVKSKGSSKLRSESRPRPKVTERFVASSDDHDQQDNAASHPAIPNAIPRSTPSPFIPSTTTNAQTVTASSASLPPIIAYVHNMSPQKRSKKNTIDYTTLSLQTDASTTQEALCYSKSKRRILEESETKRSPLKIARYSKSTDKKKIVIYERTLLSAPDDLACTFEYCTSSDEPVTYLEDP